MSMQTAILVLFIIGNAILSLMVYRNNPKSWTNKLFTFLMILLTLYLTFNTILYAFDGKDLKLIVSRVIIALGALINQAVFLFLMTFPKNKISLKKKYLYPISAITLGLFVAGFTKLIFSDITIDNNIVEPVPGLLMPVFLIHTIGLIFGGIILSLFRLKKSQGIEKVKLRFILVSFFALFSLIIALNFILTVFFKYGNFVPFLPMYIFVFNILITYAIIRHKLLDIKPIVTRAVTYAFLLFIIITLYTVSVFGLVKFLPSTTNQNNIFVSMAVVVAFSFNAIQRLLEKTTRKVLFRGQYNTEDLLNKLTHIMASEIDVKSLSTKLLKILTSEMIVTKGSFIFVEKGHITEIEPPNFGDKNTLQEKELADLTKDNKELYILEELTNSKIEKTFKELNISVALPLKVKNQAIGLLVLGPKASGDIYNNQDLELLEIFASQAAITLQNAESYRQIQLFSKTLEKKVEERTKELKETQARELSKAKQLLKIKDEFVFIATHDLGAPVTAIKGFVHLLEQEEKKLSKNSRENIEALKEASERLSDLTDDLLNVAESESGVIEIETKAVDIIALIRSTIRQAKIQAKEKDVSIENKLHAEKCLVLADEEKLSEVIENLLSNAIKYNKEKGQVTITTQLLKDAVKVDIADTGIGIPKSHHSKIFQKFVRLKQVGTEGISGTGLGLFVVRMMVEKMKGKISFTSAEGKGTTFSFILPLATSKSLKKPSK